MNPLVPPENLPSVTIATCLPSPWPTRAAVVASISRMPGPPFGPSYLITTTSPGTIPPFETSSKAASSRSKTRALPSNVVISTPAVLITAPSGASVPRSITAVPVPCMGLSVSRSMPGVSAAPPPYPPSCGLAPSGPAGTYGATDDRFCDIVFPVTVMQSPLSSPASSSFFITSGMPPMRSSEFIT